MTKKYNITKHNKLINASYQLNLVEQKLLLLAIHKIDPRKPFNQEIHLHASEFGAFWGIHEKKSYQTLLKATKGLFSRQVNLGDEKVGAAIRWVEKIFYHKDKGFVTLKFTESITPYLSKLHAHFTTYSLKAIAEVDSIYAIRLYEFLMQYKSKGIYIVNIADLRYMLDLNEKYPIFRDFKNVIIKRAVNELEKKTNLSIDWEIKKQNGKPHTLVFRFEEPEFGV